MMKKLIALVPNLGSNHLGRVYPLVSRLDQHFDIEVVGFITGRGVYPPYRNAFQYHKFSCQNWAQFFKSLPGILERLIEADVVIAFKPRFLVLFPAILAKIIKVVSLRNQLLVIVDMEDDEYLGFLDYHRTLRARLSLWFRGLIHPNSLALVHLSLPLLLLVDRKTVSSSVLQRRFGGETIRQGADEDWFKKDRISFESALATWQTVFPQLEQCPLDHETYDFIVFAGFARKHKGVHVLAEAVRIFNDELRCQDRVNLKKLKILLVGTPPNYPYVKTLKSIAGEYLRVFPPVDHRIIPSIWRLSKVAVFPSDVNSYSAQCQVPTKIFETMCMEIPTIVSNVGDLSEIVHPDERLVLEEFNARALAQKLYDLCTSDDLEVIGRELRARAIEIAGKEVMTEQLMKVVGV